MKKKLFGSFFGTKFLHRIDISIFLPPIKKSIKPVFWYRVALFDTVEKKIDRCGIALVVGNLFEDIEIFFESEIEKLLDKFILFEILDFGKMGIVPVF